jgi:hypothetical protein
MDLIRDVVVAGESDGTAQRGRELARAWGRVIRARDSAAVSGGLKNAWGTSGAGVGDRRYGRPVQRVALADERGHRAVAGLEPAGLMAAGWPV